MESIKQLQSIDHISVHGKSVSLETISDAIVEHMSDDRYSILMDGITYSAVVRKSSDKSYRIKIEGRLLDVRLIRKIDQIVQNMGYRDRLNIASVNITSPMPGLIKKIFTHVGETVLQHQNLLVLEAMKMENVIKSPKDGIIKSILVMTGQPVDKTQVLVEFEK